MEKEKFEKVVKNLDGVQKMIKDYAEEQFEGTGITVCFSVGVHGVPKEMAEGWLPVKNLEWDVESTVLYDVGLFSKRTNQKPNNERV